MRLPRVAPLACICAFLGVPQTAPAADAPVLAAAGTENEQA